MMCALTRYTLKHTRERTTRVRAPVLMTMSYKGREYSLFFSSLGRRPSFLLLISSMLTYKYPYGAEVLALCTDKLESSMLYDRFIRDRLVRRFKNGRRAPRLPFFIPRLTLFCFLISRLLKRAGHLLGTSHLYSTIAEAKRFITIDVVNVISL